MTFLSEPASGVSATSPEARMRPDDLVGALGRFLRRVHAAPTADAAGGGPTPTTVDVDAALSRARARVAAGGVPDLVDGPYRGHSAARVLDVAEELARRLVGGPLPVVVHGSLRLEGISIDGGEVVGWPTAAPAVGDPYVDLAALAIDLAAAVGPGAVPALFDAADHPAPDPVRVEVWCLLRQLV